MNIVLKPKCLNPDIQGKAQCLGHSARGYLTPCCMVAVTVSKYTVEWIDGDPNTKDAAHDIFFQEKLKIINNNNIIDIIQSKEWLDFYKLLQEEPDKAPLVCHKHCSHDSPNDTVR
jgi:hypothetical protein